MDDGGPEFDSESVSDVAELTRLRLRASLSNTELPHEFAHAVRELERLLGMPVWLLVQGVDTNKDMDDDLEDLFLEAWHFLPKEQPIALLLESPGGQADCAYRIARLLQRRCLSFKVIVPNWAKSAATLLSLGAEEIIFGEHGQLGPIDVQMYDHDREEVTSALNETQTVERIHAAALDAMDTAMLLLLRRTRKRVDALLPHLLRFVSDTARPLLEKVDVVKYTHRLRALKVGEEYAVRLLQHHMPAEDAKEVARGLVENYPDHGFVIDLAEAEAIGLNAKAATDEMTLYLDQIWRHLRGMVAYGRVVEL